MCDRRQDNETQEKEAVVQKDRCKCQLEVRGKTKSQRIQAASSNWKKVKEWILPEPSRWNTLMLAY
jgi:hypothetical protein